MKKLIITCFSFIFIISSILSFLEFDAQSKNLALTNQDGISLRGDVTAPKLMELVGDKLKENNIDILLKEVEKEDGRYIYRYYKTSFSPDFIKILGTAPQDGECFATSMQEGYDCKYLPISSIGKEIIVFNWSEAEKKNLIVDALILPEGKYDTVCGIFEAAGIELGGGGYSRSGSHKAEFRIAVFIFPLCLTYLCVLIYSLLNVRKRAIQTMEGYSYKDILFQEIKDIGAKAFLMLIITWIIRLVFAKIVFNPAAFGKYCNSTMEFLILECGIVLFAFFIVACVTCFRYSVNHLKGQAPHKAAYVAAMAFKAIFLLVMIAITSEGLMQLEEDYTSYSRAKNMEDRAANYVTLTPAHFKEAAYVHKLPNFARKNKDAFHELYRRTSEENGAILINSSIYAYRSGKSRSDMFKDIIDINFNYLDENPIYTENGERIKKEILDKNKPYVIYPKDKIDRKEKYAELFRYQFKEEANLLTYDPSKSRICTYNINSGNEDGIIEDPVLTISDEVSLTKTGYWDFFYIYLGNKNYFFKPHTDDPEAEFRPMLRELFDWDFEIESLAKSFYDQTLDRATTFGHTLALFLLIVVVVLYVSLASAKLYCENHKKKTSQALIDGISLWRCVKSHLVGIFSIHAVIAVLLGAIYWMWPIGRAEIIAIIGCLSVDLLVSIALCSKYSRANLQKILKGSDV